MIREHVAIEEKEYIVIAQMRVSIEVTWIGILETFSLRR